MNMRNPTFIPSAPYDARMSAMNALEAGLGDDVRFLAIRMDRALNGSHVSLFTELSAAVRFATMYAEDGDRFQVLEVSQQVVPRMAERSEIEACHYDTLGPIGFQYRYDEHCFTRALAEAEKARLDRSAWDGGAAASTSEVAMSRGLRRSVR